MYNKYWCSGLEPLHLCMACSVLNYFSKSERPEHGVRVMALGR